MSAIELPRISVVTPSYNQAAFLEATIRSVLDQQYPNLQYGVVDGASTDGSDKVIEQYRDQLDFAIIEPDKGQVEAINKGLRRVDGEILCYLNSDDILTPGSLRAVGEYFAAHPDRNWVVGHCLTIDPEGNRIVLEGNESDTLISTPVSQLRHALTRDERFEVPQPSVFWRKSLMDQVGLFDDSLHYVFDFEMWCRFLAHGERLYLIDQPLSGYRFHEASKTCSQAFCFIGERLQIEKRYAGQLHVRDRMRLRRAIGYRTRQYVIGTSEGRPVGQAIRRPWWLLSQQFREALLQSSAA